MTRVLLPLAQDCKELEAVTIIDLHRRAGIEVIAAGQESGPVTASRGVRIGWEARSEKASLFRRTCDPGSCTDLVYRLPRCAVHSE